MGATAGHFWGCTDNQCPDSLISAERGSAPIIRALMISALMIGAQQ
ncbi:unnamed protein product [Staurois parvus]|uniref:Uncharacterized protein n=1 Tax=Staurois parvus TaxID=386267 RepID=A0ABN9GPR8_9NEOB|nr:unnamed protein product [Staurois parvus]